MTSNLKAAKGHKHYSNGVWLTGCQIGKKNMRWEVVTEKNRYVVSATNTSDAVAYIRNKKKDNTRLKSVKLMPKNFIDTLKSKWRERFGK